MNRFFTYFFFQPIPLPLPMCGSLLSYLTKICSYLYIKPKLTSWKDLRKKGLYFYNDFIDSLGNFIQGILIIFTPLPIPFRVYHLPTHPTLFLYLSPFSKFQNGFVIVVLFLYYLSLFCVYEYFICMYVCVPCSCSAHGGQKRTSEPLGARAKNGR